MSLSTMIVSLFFVLNSLGNIPLFVGILASYSSARQRRIIIRELLIALTLLLVFNFFGATLLKLLGVSQSVLGVAGGTLLFLIAISMIFPRNHEAEDTGRSEPFIVPLATPLVAGPGAIATTIVYAEQIQNVWLSALVVLLAWIPTFCLLFLSSNIKDFIGSKGLLACQKLGGMLISLIATQMICSGLLHMLRDTLCSLHSAQ